MGVEAGNELRRTAVGVVIAGVARGEQAVGLTDVARVEVCEARDELLFERLEAAAVRACVGELARVGRLHLRPRAGRRRPPLPVADDGLDVRQREARGLALADPPDTHERLGSVESVATLGSRDGPQEIELLVEVNGTHRLARLTCEIT